MAKDDEISDELRIWADQVARKRKWLTRPKGKVVVATYEKDGLTNTISRPKRQPALLKSFIKKDDAVTGRSLSLDVGHISELWHKVVGKDIGDATSVFGLKNGVLTITVTSAALLQEIRQFHQKAILDDLRDIWDLQMPLVKAVYKLGKR